MFVAAQINSHREALWVINVILSAGQALPLSPQLQTFRCVALSEATGP
jgi:hypothetical protein